VILKKLAELVMAELETRGDLGA